MGKLLVDCKIGKFSVKLTSGQGSNVSGTSSAQGPEPCGLATQHVSQARALAALLPFSSVFPSAAPAECTEGLSCLYQEIKISSLSKLPLNSGSNNQTYPYKKIELCNSKTGACKEKNECSELGYENVFLS